MTQNLRNQKQNQEIKLQISKVFMMRDNASKIRILNNISLLSATWVILSCTKDKLLSAEEEWISSFTVIATREYDILPYMTEQAYLIGSENTS